MKLIKLVLLSLLLANCSNHEQNNDSISLNGHWHLFDVSYGSDKIYYKLDIENDTIGYFEGINFIVTSDYRNKPPQKNIFPDKKKAIFWADGMWEQFEYELKNDTLFLRNDYDQKLEYYAIKKSQSDPTKDIFSVNQTELVLPIITPNDSIVKKTEGTFYAEILFGKNKYNGKAEIEIERRLASEDQSLDLMIEKFKIKIPESRPIGAILNIGEATDQNKIDEIVNLLVAHNFKDIIQRKTTKEGKLQLVNYDH